MSSPINRSFLGAFSIATLALASTALAQSPVKIGVLEDQSGEFAAATLPKVHGIELSVGEVKVSGTLPHVPHEIAGTLG